jgi:hypothetical protein
VIVHDIYEHSKSTVNRFAKGNDDVHYSPEGYKEMGLPISDFLRNAMQ